MKKNARVSWTLGRVLLVVVALGLTPAVVRAGAADAQIDCTSEDGATLAGIIPRDNREFDVTFRVGDKQRRWAASDRVASFSQFEDKLLAFQTKGAPRITLVAVPKTLKVKGGRHRQTAKFRAHVTTPAELLEGTGSRRWEMACSYLYEI